MIIPLRFFGTKLAKIYGTVIRIAGFSGGIAAWMAALLIIAAVVARSVFDYAIVFSAEYSTYLVCYIVFIGASYTMRIRQHISVDLVVSRLPEGIVKWLEVIQLVLCVVFSVAFLAHAINIVRTSSELGTVSITAMATPLVYPYLIMPVGFFLLTIESSIQLYRRISILTRR